MRRLTRRRRLLRRQRRALHHEGEFKCRLQFYLLGLVFFMNYTDKKENQSFLIYREIPSGAVAKSYMRKGFLIYEEMRKYFPIYEVAGNLYDFATALL